VAEWFTHLEAAHVDRGFHRPDDPRLGEVIETWQGDAGSLSAGRAVIVGFPQDEGVRRNHGRAGAALAPALIRNWLYRLVSADAARNVDLAARPPLDVGDVRLSGPLEETQEKLGHIVAAILRSGAVPIVLGGGHETAFGHYLGYAEENRSVAILNLDAHLDVRPCTDGKAHSGSPFRQAFEHPTHALGAGRYVCFGAQPQSVGRSHAAFIRRHGGHIDWCDDVRSSSASCFVARLEQLAGSGCPIYVSLDVDVVHVADAPGVSAPNLAGLGGTDVLRLTYLAGQSLGVCSFDIVEANPLLDRDDQTVRWSALAVWNFLIGLAKRQRPPAR
jgi:formiminoglutamase